MIFLVVFGLKKTIISTMASSYPAKIKLHVNNENYNNLNDFVVNKINKLAKSCLPPSKYVVLMLSSSIFCMNMVGCCVKVCWLAT